MKKHLYFLCIVLVAAVLMALVRSGFNNSADVPTGMRPDAAIGCAPGSGDRVTINEDGKFISVLPGWGNHAYVVSTQNDSAQLYFNQGLTLYYSYHMKEAAASFKEAAKFDSACAMMYWGQALAMGPTYNAGHAYTMSGEIPAVLRLMNAYSSTASASEQALITAMNKRYDPQDLSDSKRKQLNLAYAEAMQPLASIYSQDADVKALYIDAVMLEHPWDFWSNDGTAKKWTPELLRLCESVMKQDPQHPAGLHYYIHLTEASHKPEVALPNADSLLKLFPGVGHMVHMASHEYERIGYFEKGVQVNEAANKSLADYAALQENLNLMKHSNHYYAVGTYCAMSGGMYKTAMEKSGLLRKATSPDHQNTYEQYLYMFPTLTKVRMGKWQEILQEENNLSKEWTYANILDDFAKGMAYAKTGDFKKAERCLKQIQQNERDVVLKKRFVPHMSSAYECAVIARQVLLANIKFQQGKHKQAIDAIKNAINAEDQLIYTEPKLWMLPARQYMGVFLLQMKQPTEAEKIYREDLVWNPGNGWSLLGLHQSLKAQQKIEQLRDFEKQYLHSFSAADELPQRSAY